MTPIPGTPDITQPTSQPEDLMIVTGRVLLAPTTNGSRSYRCLFIGAGRVRRADGEESSWLIPAEVLRTSVDLFAGVPSYLDHPALFGFGWRSEPSLRNLVGICGNPEWDEEEQGVVGTLQLYDDDPNSPGAFIGSIYDRILDDRAAGRKTPEIGLSAVLWHDTHFDDETGLRITDHISKIDSLDHVYSAGARGYVKEALSAFRGSPDGCPSLSVLYRGTNAPTYQGGLTMATEPTQGQEQEHSTSNAPQQMVTEQPAAARETVTIQTDPALLATLELVNTRLEAIESRQAQLDEDHTIQGMGNPPRATHGMITGMDQIEQAVEALLGGVRPPSGVRPLSGIRELYTLLSGDFEMTGVYQPEQIYLANVTSSTMAQLVANVLNKRVMIAFAQYPKWWEKIVTIENFASLQQVRWITLGGVGELPTVSEGAAYTELTWDDLAQRDNFVKKGGYLGLTLEAIDKDDTRRIQVAPRALAQAAWLTLSKSISAIFTASSGVGPNVYYDDSNQRALFHSSNSNLGTTALSVSSWETTRQLMRDQTEHNSSEPLGALTAPKYLLVPNELEFAAIQILATAQIPGTANYNINPEAVGDQREARLRVARDRVIVIDLWTDANDWAAVADPLLYPSIGLGYRFGEVPEIFSVADPRAGLMFSNDVMPVKVRYFYATGPVDYRGMYKHNV